MREIKFRAWDIKANKMDNLRNNTWLEFCNYCSPQLVNSGAVGYERIATEDFILMQYTGLKDKNGVKIFEGDIVKIKYVSQPKEVKYSAVLASFLIGNDHRFTALLDVEVIGNIYESPELLENQVDEER